MGREQGVSLFVVVLQLLWLAPLAFALWNRRVSRAIASRPPVGMATAPLGQRVLLEGWAAPAQAAPRPSTLQQVSCLWHEWRVHQEPRALDGNLAEEPYGSLDHSEQGATEAPFALENRAGDRVLIDPARATVEAVEGRRWTALAPRPGGGAPSLSLVEYIERWIAPGQPLFVLGRLDPPEPGDPLGFRGRLSQGGGGLFVIAGQAPEMLFAAANRRASRALWLAGILLPIALVATVWLLR